MAFFKTGDAQQITGMITTEGPSKCDKCGKNITTLKITDTQNEETCDCETDGENND